MGEITLFTGGARSGKSMHAQEAAMSYKDVAYVATALVTDSEMADRIMRHKSTRPFNWVTYECPYDIVGGIESSAHEAYLIDCITVFLTNLIFQLKDDWDDVITLTALEQENLKRAVDRKVDDLIAFIKKKDASFIIVSNEVGMGVVPGNPMGRLFRDIAGKVNQRLAKAAKEVYFTVSGIPVKVKG